MLASQNEFGSLPSSWILWNSVRRWVFSSQNVLQNSPVKPSGPGLLFVGSFLITASISLGVICLFNFSDSSWFIFRRLFVGICSLRAGCPVCWHIVVHNIFLPSFVFLQCQLLFLFFHFWFYLFASFSFFLDESD